MLKDQDRRLLAGFQIFLTDERGFNAGQGIFRDNIIGREFPEAVAGHDVIAGADECLNASQDFAHRPPVSPSSGFLALAALGSHLLPARGEKEGHSAASMRFFGFSCRPNIGFKNSPV